MRARTLAVLLAAGLALSGEDPDIKQKTKNLKDLAKAGSESVPKIVPFLSDPSPDVRREAAKALTVAGGLQTLDPLTKALSDSDPAVQICAIDGIVNFYIPGFARDGVCNSLKDEGAAGMSSSFKQDSEDVIAPDVTVRAGIVQAMIPVLSSSPSMAARADAARGIGVLRGRVAIPQLSAALRSKDDGLMFESLVALRKIGDSAAGSVVTVAVRDLNPKVQLAAIEAAGSLGSKEAVPGLRRVLDGGSDKKMKRAALMSLAQIADPSSRPVFLNYVAFGDDAMRAGAAEGLGRLKNPQDQAVVAKAYEGESPNEAKLSQAFALIAFGDTRVDENSPLIYLLDQLRQKKWRQPAQALLNELARDPKVRQALYPELLSAMVNADTRLGIAAALGYSAGPDAVPALEKAAKDENPDVGKAALRALRMVRSRG